MQLACVTNGCSPPLRVQVFSETLVSVVTFTKRAVFAWCAGSLMTIQRWLVP